jgi:hypothetical protein
MLQDLAESERQANLPYVEGKLRSLMEKIRGDIVLLKDAAMRVG